MSLQKTPLIEKFSTEFQRVYYYNPKTKENKWKIDTFDYIIEISPDWGIKTPNQITSITITLKQVKVDGNFHLMKAWYIRKISSQNHYYLIVYYVYWFYVLKIK